MFIERIKSVIDEKPHWYGVYKKEKIYGFSAEGIKDAVSDTGCTSGVEYWNGNTYSEDALNYLRFTNFEEYVELVQELEPRYFKEMWKICTVCLTKAGADEFVKRHSSKYGGEHDIVKHEIAETNIELREIHGFLRNEPSVFDDGQEVNFMGALNSISYDSDERIYSEDSESYRVNIK